MKTGHFIELYFSGFNFERSQLRNYLEFRVLIVIVSSVVVFITFLS